MQPRGKFLALRQDGPFPTGSPLIHLILPLEQMRQQDRHAARQFALFAPGDGLNLFRDVLSVEQLEPPGTNETGLFAGPCHQIRFVTGNHTAPCNPG